jgi:hypothetical protein
VSVDKVQLTDSEGCIIQCSIKDCIVVELPAHFLYWFVEDQTIFETTLTESQTGRLITLAIEEYRVMSCARHIVHSHTHTHTHTDSHTYTYTHVHQA